MLVYKSLIREKGVPNFDWITGGYIVAFKKSEYTSHHAVYFSLLERNNEDGCIEF